MAIKNISLVCWEESLPSTIEDIIQEYLYKGNVNYYAYIKHDKDDKKIHYHVVIGFFEPTTKEQVSKKFGIKSNQVQPLSNLNGNIFYMTHFGIPDKYKYDIHDIVSYNVDVANIFARGLQSDLSVSASLKQIIQYKRFNRSNNYDLLIYCIDNGFMEIYRKYYQIIKDIN